MWIDALVTGGAVAGALAYLVWHFLPKRRPSGCSGCPKAGAATARPRSVGL